MAVDNPSTPCAFFDKLPPEIRNQVYELAFCTDNDESDQVDLINDLAPPSRALVSTCRQAKSEAGQLYKAAYRDYWTETNFCLSLKNIELRTAATDSINALNATALDHATSITLHLGDWFGEYGFKLIDPRGGWEYKSKGANANLLFAINESDKGEFKKAVFYERNEMEYVLDGWITTLSVKDQIRHLVRMLFGGGTLS